MGWGRAAEPVRLHTKNGGTGGRPALVLGTAILLAALLTPGMAGAGLRIGGALPAITLFDIGGTAVTVPDSFRGKVFVLHFWQIGCSSCRAEMPALDDLYGKYRRKGLEVVAVNVGQRKDVVKAFAAGLKVSYPILLDADGKNAALYEVKDVPRSYVVDRGGFLRYRIIGGATQEMLQKLILSLL